MPVTLADVDYVADLAHLRFSDDERARLVEQLNDILRYVEQLNELDTTHVEPTSHVLNLKNVFRDDTIESSLPHEVALANAPATSRGHFRVPKVL
ncbi:MAG: Asp-tRNA(Asn)/Glu-tRNA(Gln) amidotransferase subunit GatC [Candidatus Latescibacteria bacterium]|nr:Asp-tRNA(Asn)/Glu-tRNA(Gln) amidotransferase subunit GatC [Candidatus Latescibacterota bacterium]